MDKVRCPHCSDDVEPPSGGGPFFCPSCHRIVDTSLRRAGVAAAPHSPETLPPDPAPHPVTHIGPGHGPAAAQTPALGYLLAAILGGAVAYGLGRLSATHLYLPLVWAGFAGWVVRTALAIGSGGGTPDRGVLGFLVLAATCLGIVGVFAWVDYDAARRNETDHWRLVFGDRGTESAKHFVKRLRDRDTDLDGVVRLAEDETTVDVGEEALRAERAVATGVKTLDPFDVPLLASTDGRRGFEGYLIRRAREGRVVKVTPTHDGWRLDGTAAIGLAVVEFLTAALFAFPRRE
jgi:hypothetical protein